MQVSRAGAKSSSVAEVQAPPRETTHTATDGTDNFLPEMDVAEDTGLDGATHDTTRPAAEPRTEQHRRADPWHLVRTNPAHMAATCWHNDRTHMVELN